MSLWSSIRSSLALLPEGDRLKYWGLVVAQVTLTGLDLAGVLIIGAVASLAFSGTSSESSLTPGPAQWLQDSFPSSWTLDVVIVLGAALAVVFFAIKSTAGAILLRTVFRFLASRQGAVSATLTSRFLAAGLERVTTRSSQLSAYALIDGVALSVVVLLGSFAVGVAEIALLALLAGTLLIVDPFTALLALFYFVAIAITLHSLLGPWAARAASTVARSQVQGLQELQQSIGAYRELRASGRPLAVVGRLQETINQGAMARADSTLVASLPKFVYETALIFGVLVLAWWQLQRSGSENGIFLVALFLAAGSRIMPSLLRMQGAVISIRNSAAGALPTFELSQELSDRDLQLDGNLNSNGSNHLKALPPQVSLQGIDYVYPDSTTPILRDVWLDLPGGKTLAIVGPTGSGKSTLADVICGVREPSQGQAKLAGLSASTFCRQNPGVVAYVPQVIGLLNGTVRDNVLLGFGAKDDRDTAIWEALEAVDLAHLFMSSRQGLDTPIGEAGFRLSGGQRQRIGLARALVQNPKLIVLDEATSALDAATEVTVSKNLSRLAGSVTMVVVAHRLSTVQNADTVAYVSSGSVMATGTFDQVRASIPDFNDQAKLMGLL